MTNLTCRAGCRTDRLTFPLLAAIARKWRLRMIVVTGMAGGAEVPDGTPVIVRRRRRRRSHGAGMAAGRRGTVVPPLGLPDRDTAAPSHQHHHRCSRVMEGTVRGRRCRTLRCPVVPGGRQTHRIMACYPVHQATMHGEDLGTGGQPCATRARYPVHRPRKSGGEGAGTAQARRHPRSKGADLTVGQLPTIPDGLPHSGKLNMYPCRRQATWMTIAGCSWRWNPRADARRHEQVFGVRRAPMRMTMLT